MKYRKKNIEPGEFIKYITGEDEYGMMPPPINASYAIETICKYTNPDLYKYLRFGEKEISNKTYAITAHEILFISSRKYRKDFKRHTKYLEFSDRDNVNIISKIRIWYISKYLAKKSNEFTKRISNYKYTGNYIDNMTPDYILDAILHYIIPDFMCVDPIHAHQVNTVIVHDILMKISRKYKNEYNYVIQNYRKERK